MAISALLLLFTTGAFALHASRPNVLFIVVDDLGVATSNYGFPAAAPNLEALAARSTQFSRAYVSMAVCAPSRTAFLTGMRPDTTRVWTIGPYFRTSAENGMNITTLPQLFRRNGYITSGSGKIFLSLLRRSGLALSPSVPAFGATAGVAPSTQGLKLPRRPSVRAALL